MKTEDEIEAIPICFKHAASTAVTSAVSILELILQDDDLRNSLVGVPHYFHTMIAFAGVVLLKVSGKYHVQLSIDLESVFTLTSSVISLFRSTACSRYHLVRWMATGLEKMLYNCRMFTAGRYGTINSALSGGPRSGLSVAENPVENWAIDAQPTEMYHGTPGSGFHNLILGNNFGSDLNMIMSDFPPGDIDLGFNFL